MKIENRNNIDNYKVQSAMRSLYRLVELQNMLSPQILIENEKRLLIRYLLELNGSEILHLSISFHSYYETELTRTALADEQLMAGIGQYLLTLN